MEDNRLVNRVDLHPLAQRHLRSHRPGPPHDRQRILRLVPCLLLSRVVANRLVNQVRIHRLAQCHLLSQAVANRLRNRVVVRQ